MTYFTEEERLILSFYMDKNMIRTAGNIIDALEETSGEAETAILVSLLNKIVEMGEETFRKEGGKLPLIP